MKKEVEYKDLVIATATVLLFIVTWTAVVVKVLCK